MGDDLLEPAVDGSDTASALRALEVGVVVVEARDEALLEVVFDVWPTARARDRAWRRQNTVKPGRAQITRVGSRVFVAVLHAPLETSRGELEDFCIGRDLPVVEVGGPDATTPGEDGTERARWMPALAGAAAGARGFEWVDVDAVQALRSTTDGVLVVCEQDVWSFVGPQRRRLPRPTAGRPRLAGLDRTVWLDGRRVHELHGDRWSTVDTPSDIAHAAPTGESGLLVLDRTGVAHVIHPEGVTEIPPVQGTGVLLALREDAVWLPKTGRLQRFRAGRWWAGAEVERAIDGAVAVGRGWVAVHCRHTTGAIRSQSGPGAGVVVPARDAGAWLLHDGVYVLDGVADQWRPVLELPFTVSEAAVQRDGTVFMRVGRRLARLHLETTASPWSPVGTREERAAGLVASLRERGWTVGDAEAAELAGCLDLPGPLAAWRARVDVPLTPDVERLVAVFVHPEDPGSSEDPGS